MNKNNFYSGLLCLLIVLPILLYSVEQVGPVPIINRELGTDIPNMNLSNKVPRQKRQRKKRMEKSDTGPFARVKPSESKELVEEGGQRFLTGFVYPFDATQGAATIQMNFKDVALSELNNFMAKAYDVTFIPDDAITSEAPAQPQFGAPPKPLALNTIKLSFHTNKPMTKKQAWDLYTTFLDLAGLTLTPGPAPRMFRITASASAKGALPTFLGVEPETLPDNDIKIRYLYFVENGNIDTISMVVNTIKSSAAAPVQQFPDIGAILITEKASNIKAIMRIVREIDRVTLPEAMSVMRLHQADATNVANLYSQLIGEAAPQAGVGYQPKPRKPTTKGYFPPNMRIIAEPRTNTLILLGTHEAIRKVEDFIKKEVDKEIELPYSPLHIYKLKHAYAPTVTQILQQVTAFNPQSVAAQYGGVRDRDKYFRPMNFVAEPSGNRIIISADYEDYLKIYDILQQLDVEQPQVAIKVLIINISDVITKEFGTQLRNTFTAAGSGTRHLLSRNVNFQNSGLAGNLQNGIVQNPPIPPATPTTAAVPFSTTPSPTVTTNLGGATRLLGNLINLAAGNEPGTTLVTLGSDIFGVWGIVKALEAKNVVEVVSNPFIIATHKTPAIITSGTTRRVLSSQTQGVGSTVNSNQDIPANLTVQITPIISTIDRVISLSVVVDSTDFTEANPTSGNRTRREVSTQAVVADKEVLGLGGLVSTSYTEILTKVPVLGDIPLLGWFFKNKQLMEVQNNLVILISAEIIDPNENKDINIYTQQKVCQAKELLCEMEVPAEKRDPIHRWFFKDDIRNNFDMIDDFVETAYRAEDVIKPTEAPIPSKPKKGIRDHITASEER